MSTRSPTCEVASFRTRLVPVGLFPQDFNGFERPTLERILGGTIQGEAEGGGGFREPVRGLPYVPASQREPAERPVGPAQVSAIAREIGRLLDQFLQGAARSLEIFLRRTWTSRNSRRP